MEGCVYLDATRCGYHATDNERWPSSFLVVAYKEIISEESRDSNILKQNRAFVPQAHLQAVSRSVAGYCSMPKLLG